VARDVTVVAAAGNEATTDRRWPAAYDAVVAVGATDENGGLAGFSNRGSSWVDLLAPGCVTSMNPQQQTVLLCGTSVATPLAAGALALLKSLSPSLPYPAIVSAVERTAVPVGPDVARFGRLDVASAMRDLGLRTSTVAPRTAVTERFVRSLASRGKVKRRSLNVRLI
jgi:subtilisin family serine protease